MELKLYFDYSDVFFCSPFSQAVGSNSSYLACNFILCGGDTVTAGVCSNGGIYTGDTVISLYHLSNQVAFNDDSTSCGVKALGSQLSYTPPKMAPCSTYILHQYCYAQFACTGTSAIEVSSAGVYLNLYFDVLSIYVLFCKEVSELH